MSVSMPNRSSIVKRKICLFEGLPATNLVFPDRKAKTMTVGVGAICEAGNCIVLGSDTRGSYAKQLKLSPNDWTSKTYDLPHGFFACIAGIISKCLGVSIQLADEMEKLQAPFQLDHVRHAINDARFYEMMMNAGDQIHAQFGVSLKKWQKLPRNAAVYRGGKAIIRSQPLEVQIIVAGFVPWPLDRLPRGASPILLLRAHKKCPVEIEGNFTTIGTGGDKARKVLDRRGQHPHRSWQRTAIDVIYAMRAAHRANRRSVGTPADLFILRNGSAKRFPVNATYVQHLLRVTGNQKRQKELRNSKRFVPRTEAILESLLYDQPNAP
jgi:hypothetical protein